MLVIIDESAKEVVKIDREEKLKELMDGYSKLVFSICYRLTNDYFTAEDDELEFRAGASPGLEDEYMNAQLGRDIRAACEALREPYRSVAVEYFCEDMPLSQIAERTGEPLKTVQTRAYRAKKMLRENLKEVILQ